MQYTKTTDTAGSGGYQAYGFSPVIYSTEEREVGVWTDNKPLYQKTFLFNQQVISDNAWTSNILGTVGSGIEIVDYEGMFGLLNTNPHFADFDYYRSSSEYFTAYIINNNGSNDDIGVRPNMNAGTSVTLDKCTIWYTKDSDTAGSGSYNTLGVPTVHYTTDEQVIGTWIDGKPLYRKTVTYTGVSGARNSLDLNIANVDYINLVPEGSCADNRPLPYVTGTDNSNNIGGFFDIQTTTTTFEWRSGSGSTSSTDVILTVQYTKTTD